MHGDIFRRVITGYTTRCLLPGQTSSSMHATSNANVRSNGTSIKYKVERDKRYLPYIELGRWLCSHFQLKTPLNFHQPITQKLYNIEQ